MAAAVAEDKINNLIVSNSRFKALLKENRE
jgi:hypothetical protein